MDALTTTRVVQVAGAGPAGLAAAIVLARAGRKVIVHEAKATVGARFQRDLQGLENWTGEQDVLVELQQAGITTDFRYRACGAGTVFDAWGNAYPMRSEAPLFYMVERGPEPGSLDAALLRQAQDCDVEVRFNSRVDKLARPALLATGPKAADAIAAGYHFDTDIPDGYWAICDDRLAPGGYAYLLIMDGRGTVKTCMFHGFNEEKRYVARTVEAFRGLVGLQMKDPRPHGGVGNFHMPRFAGADERLSVGEHAGFQDTLWGFGMRMAMLSGVMAARSLLQGVSYQHLWQHRFRDVLEVSIVNRACYALLGNRGYRWFLRRQSNTDAREFLHRQYSKSLLKRLLLPWARMSYRSHRYDSSCHDPDCQCVWCRCAA